MIGLQVTGKGYVEAGIWKDQCRMFYKVGPFPATDYSAESQLAEN